MELGTGKGNWELGAKKKKDRELKLGIATGSSELGIRAGIGDWKIETWPWNWNEDLQPGTRIWQ